MRQRRSLLGMSQTAVGDAVGLTFQQIQKYERGSNRVSSSRLFEFAKVLDVPVSYFFDEIREARVRKRIFEMVKAVGAASHAEVLGGRKGRNPRHASS
jgi:transcriptional regulator with XRE-family HTH domain